MTPSTPPKGSLEDLFRHHLLESEAAAVPPRAQVWEQLDNSLLLAQNEQYRRRLRVHRWAIAASLLLASLAGGGWWHSQQPQSPTLATATSATRQPNGVPGLATVRRAVATPVLATAASPLATSRPTPTSTPNLTAIDQTSTLRATTHSTASYAAVGRAATSSARTQAAGRVLADARRANTLAAGQQTKQTDGIGAPTSYLTNAVVTSARTLAGGTAPASAMQAARGTQRGTLPRTGGTEPAAMTLAAELPMGKQASGAEQLTTDQAAMALAHTGVSDLAARDLAIASLSTHQANLESLGAAGLPTNLSPVDVTMPPVELARHWQFGLAYAASAFQPNIDFTRPVTTYSSALSLNSASVTNTAAVEYRNNLRAGLGQRLSFWASRRLGGSRWRLRTGLEVAQNTATSATSMAFVGEQVANLTYAQPVPYRLQRTSYRYRSASAAAEMRYASPLKTGFSLYGRVGAVLTALLNVRSDVDGTPEASRTYNMLSTDSPYRHLTTSLRGGGGIQYRPVGHQWALNLGPVAEFGIMSLNADPTQDFWHQQRPYSFGLEAGLELGRSLRIQ